MNQQPLRVEGPGLSWRGLSHRSTSRRVERTCPAVVVVSWDCSTAAGESHVESSQIELETEVEGNSDSATKAAWTCRGASERGWVDAISASRCAEVVLTANVGDSASAQQAVLELAGSLTRKLELTRPVVRVRFLPPRQGGPKRAP